MGANARRRHGAIDTTPKVGTPLEDRAIPERFDASKGWVRSNRALKRRDERLKMIKS